MDVDVDVGIGHLYEHWLKHNDNNNNISNNNNAMITIIGARSLTAARPTRPSFRPPAKVGPAGVTYHYYHVLYIITVMPYIYIYIYICIHVYVCVYIYI